MVGPRCMQLMDKDLGSVSDLIEAPQSERQRVQEGTGGHIEALSGWGCVPASLRPCPQCPGDAELRLADNVLSHCFPGFRPPGSPGHNLLDYYVCGLIERENNGRPRSTIRSVKQSVYDVMTNMFRVALAEACEWLRRRIEAVVAAGGSL